MDQHQNSPLIVVVDDNSADVMLLKRSFDHLGEPYRLHVLEDGEKALAYLQAHAAGATEEPCVVVLDLHLPRYDGTAILQYIRAEPRLAHLKVAVLTSSLAPNRQPAVNLYRQKPMSLEAFDVLARELVALCKERSHHAPAIAPDRPGLSM